MQNRIHAKRPTGTNASATQTYAVAGILFGFLFPIGATLIRMATSGMPIGLASAVYAQSTDPVLWIVDSATIVLGLLATFAGSRQDAAIQLNIALRERQEELRTIEADLEQREIERTATLDRRTLELEAQKQQSEYRAKQFEAITKVARAISNSRNLKELLPQISNVISEQFGYYHVGIFLNDTSNEVALLSAANSEGGQRMLARRHQLKIGEQGIVGYVTGTGRPRIALDVGEDAVFFNNPDLPDTRSEMALPLKIADLTIGALDVQSVQPNAFSADDVDLLSTLADQVSLAIQNASLFEQTRKALTDSEAIARQYVRQAWHRLPEEDKLAGFRYTASGAEPIEKESRRNGSEFPADSERPFFEVPIQLRGETIGKLKVQVENASAIKGTQLDLIKAVAERVALSAENARLFEETTRRAERERRVSEITTKIRSVNDPQQMINTAIEELRQALGATRVEVVPQRLSDKTDK